MGVTVTLPHPISGHSPAAWVSVRELTDLHWRQLPWDYMWEHGSLPPLDIFRPTHVFGFVLFWVFLLCFALFCFVFLCSARLDAVGSAVGRSALVQAPCLSITAESCSGPRAQQGPLREHFLSPDRLDCDTC